MVVRAIQEVLGLREPVVFIRVGSSQPIEISAANRQAIPFVHPEWNIAEAQRNGVQPVNFHELREQFPKYDFSNAVLFDTPPHGMGGGNHWRVTGVNDDYESVTIQLCGIFGNHDYHMPPFTVSQYDILFTGLKIEQYVQNRNLIYPLSAVVNLIATSAEYPKNLKLTKETIYWADANGKLLLMNKHPLFKKR